MISSKLGLGARADRATWRFPGASSQAPSAPLARRIHSRRGGPSLTGSCPSWAPVRRLAIHQPAPAPVARARTIQRPFMPASGDLRRRLEILPENRLGVDHGFHLEKTLPQLRCSREAFRIPAE